MIKQYYVYMMTSSNRRVIYTGVTGDIEKRIWEHKNKIDQNSFTSKYNVNKLVHLETFSSPEEAIGREKQIKAGSRERKLRLINESNPKWEDLSLVS